MLTTFFLPLYLASAAKAGRGLYLGLASEYFRLLTCPAFARFFRVALGILMLRPCFGTCPVLRPSERAGAKGLQLLKTALNEAVALGHVPKNAALSIKIPRATRKKAGKSWTSEQAKVFLDANQDTSLYPLWLLMLNTGVRIGEALALSVNDYDTQKSTLRVHKLSP